jgi:SAM-dependent methyltransferase
MLIQARAKKITGSIRFERVAAEDVEDLFAAGSVDLIFMSQVVHHLKQPEKVVKACHHILSAHGAIFIRNSTVDAISSIPYVNFFAASRRLLAERMPSRASLGAIFGSAGFKTSAVGAIEQQVADNYAAYADKLALKGDSILVSLSADEFDAGLLALRSYAARAGNVGAVVEAVDFFVFRK